MSKPLVSVIIPCYNKGLFIEETIQSVLQQDYNNIEIIIVNDGSTDTTKNVLDSISHPKIKIVHTPNSGVVSARNTAVLHTSGKYILPLDADDLLAPTYTSEAVEILEKNRNIGIVYCDAEKFGAENGKWHLEEYSFETILQTNPIHVSAFFRRSDYDKTCGWNPNTEYFFEDWDFFLSLIELGVEVYKIPKTLFYYRILPNSRTRLLEKEKTKKALRQVYLNHSELYAKHFKDPLNMYSEIHELEKIQKEYQLVINSLSYKIGRAITWPLRLLRGPI